MSKLHLFSPGTTNAKQSKDTGHTSYILYLAPSNSAHPEKNICPSTKTDNSCVKDCLFYCGRGGFDNVMQARTRRTNMLHFKSDQFWTFSAADLYWMNEKAGEAGEKWFVRSQGTSDLNFWLLLEDRTGCRINRLENLIAYEYTKVPGYLRTRNNVHYTYSLMESQSNMASAIKAIEAGYGVSKIYRGELPGVDVFNGKEYRVIDGDESDLRPLDRERYDIPVGEGYIVGLKFKKPRKIKLKEIK